MPAPFTIHVVDRAGDPAPCVVLRTTDAQEFQADAQGRVAFDEPGLMGGEVWFHVKSPAYDVPADFFGYRGVALTPVAGGSATVTVDRRGDPGPCTAPDQGVVLTDGFVDPPFDLHVVDSVTGRGVPMVRVDGPHGPHWTDSAGHVALRHPALFEGPGEWSAPALHGYEGEAAVTVTPTPGGSATLRVVRHNVAERLYRVTGRGIYRDSVLLGLPTPLREPALAGRVMGQDSILVVPHDGGWLWMWGDTSRPEYPLGLFDVAGARAEPLPDPADGVDLEYFVDGTGFARAMAPVPGDGPTWLVAPVIVDDAGSPVTVAFYGKFASDLSANERGLTLLDEPSMQFLVDTVFPGTRLALTTNLPLLRDGRVWLASDRLRFAATLDAARDPRTWEVWSPRLADGSVDTWPDGVTRWAWRVVEDEAQFDVPEDSVVEHATGLPVDPHGDTVAWSPFRRRFVRVFTENAGTSWLGEMWYAEADTPVGPWSRAVKIASHTTYTSYNPLVHPELSGDGRSLLWQATYTAWLATDELTPLYDYNQVMYRLDLEDPRAVLPVPVYEVGDGLGTVADLRPGDGQPTTRFLAPDRPFADSAPVRWDGPACDGGRQVVGEGLGSPVFHVATDDPGGGALPLWHATAERADGLFVVVPAGFDADPEPVGWVWPVGDAARSDVLAWLPEVRVDAGPDRCAVEAAPGAGAAVSVDATASPGTSAQGWSVTLDGEEVATSPTAEVAVPAGRHTLSVTWTSPAGERLEDEVLVAVAAAEPPDPEPTEPTEPTDPLTHSGVDAPAQGCGCASGPGPSAHLLVGLLALRRRAPPRQTRHSRDTSTMSLASTPSDA
jgi:hypothetical protein